MSEQSSAAPTGDPPVRLNVNTVIGGVWYAAGEPLPLGERDVEVANGCLRAKC
jgi:hypothetical protein